MRARPSLLRLVTPWLLWAVQTNAHAGKSLGAELHAREAYAQENSMDLSHCAEKFHRDGVFTRAVERRIGQRDSLQKRSDNSGNIKGSEASKRAFDPADIFNIFSTAGNGCVLHPELDEGPYYVEGEKVRDDLVDGQDGVILFLDFQIVDTHSCEPVEGVYVEIWHTNATGVYSGVVSDGNGSGEDDPKNAYRTFNRGAQRTDEDGVVFFRSIFPGHYSGRASHVHVMTHIKPKIVGGKIISDTATHIGQLFFDQGLIHDVEKLSPYQRNRQDVTPNHKDNYFGQAMKTSDPIMSWLTFDYYDINDAVLAWMPIGVNMSNVREAHVAAALRS